MRRRSILFGSVDGHPASRRPTKARPLLTALVGAVVTVGFMTSAALAKPLEKSTSTM